MGRHCAVPNCYSGYRRYKNDEKISLYKVPDDEYFLLKWNEAIAREDRPVTPRDYVCDKHFTQDDIIKTRVIKDIVVGILYLIYLSMSCKHLQYLLPHFLTITPF